MRAECYGVLRTYRAKVGWEARDSNPDTCGPEARVLPLDDLPIWYSVRACAAGRLAEEQSGNCQLYMLA